MQYKLKDNAFDDNKSYSTFWTKLFLWRGPDLNNLETLNPHYKKSTTLLS